MNNQEIINKHRKELSIPFTHTHHCGEGVDTHVSAWAKEVYFFPTPYLSNFN